MTIFKLEPQCPEILSSKNMIFGAVLSKIFERFFKKSFNSVKVALNVKVIYETLVNLLILNKFSLGLWVSNQYFAKSPKYSVATQIHAP